LLLNTNGQFLFNRGILETRACTVSNTFVVGDSNNFAIYQLIPTVNGTNLFAKGLYIASNASLIGNGLITGTVTNSGVIAPGGSAGRIDINGNLVLTP